jgi:hypothetical protein
MALTSAYLITTKNLESVINSIVSAKAPERFTNKFLEDLGFKSSNDRLYVGIFRALGLVDDNGQPLQRYYEFIDQTQTGKVLAQGIEEAYSDLFSLRKDAQNLTNEEVKNKLKTLTQGQKSDTVLGNMTSTFKALCNLADWSKFTKNEDDSPKKIEHENPQQIQRTKAVEPTDNKNSNMNLHYNIQLHLPETSNMAVYDAIFQSLKKHLM